jgi:hypothetical protein
MIIIIIIIIIIINNNNLLTASGLSPGGSGNARNMYRILINVLYVNK